MTDLMNQIAEAVATATAAKLLEDQNFIQDIVARVTTEVTKTVDRVLENVEIERIGGIQEYVEGLIKDNAEGMVEEVLKDHDIDADDIGNLEEKVCSIIADRLS